jgi:hypothetical protein
MDAADEEQLVLEAARGATRLWHELREPIANVPLDEVDDNEDDFADLPDDVEAEEASYEPWQERAEDAKTFTEYLEDAERHRRQVVEDRQRRRLASKRCSDDGAGPSSASAGPSGGQYI